MTSAVVVSDSHGNVKGLDALDGLFDENDLIIHLGDTSQDGGYIKKKFPDKTVIINGNCDLFKLGENERIIEAGGVKIFACHGHLYSVKRTLSLLAERAKEAGCRIALYGHTHEAREDVINGVTLINPGCFSRYSQKSYLYLLLHGGKFTAKIVYLG